MKEVSKLRGVLGAGTLAVLACVPVLLAPAAADAAISAHTDVVFLFDTTGSMKPALAEAKKQIRATTEEIDSQIPDVQYGVAEVRDYGGSAYAEKEPDIMPWTLDLPITADRTAVAESIEGLEAYGGGDRPEAYARAIWETESNPTVGWRRNTRRLIVLLADSMPHDPELNEGIPESLWIKASPWTTDEELLAPAGVSGTLIGAGAVLDWQRVLERLAVTRAPLEVVDYWSEYLPYWENWAARTGGEALPDWPGHLDKQLVNLVVAGTRGPCPTVHGSTGKMLLAALRCKPALKQLAGKCGRRLTKGRKGFSPPVKLVNDVRGARFLGSAPVGFQGLDGVLERFKRARTAIDLIKSLPHLVKAVPRRDFREIALDVADVPAAKACALGLLVAVQ